MKKYIFITIITALNLFGCDNFVEVDMPASQLPGETIFEDAGTANGAMAEVYAKLRDSGVLDGSGLGTSYNLGLYADELTYYALGGNESFSNTMLASGGTTASIWSNSYTQVYGANAIIEGVAHSQSLDAALRDRLTGEALFIRALVHFYLVNLYGDVPYVTTTDYEVNRLVARMPEEEVYQHIMIDLNEAITLLRDEYPSPERVRANKAVAQALLARAYLYHGDWAQASDMASAVINNPVYQWEPDLEKVFLMECTSAIWQLMPKQVGDNATEGSTFIFESGPPPRVALSAALAASFEPGDLRRQYWVKEITDGTNIWYHANKYRQNSNTGISLEYSVVFRLAEQYLIRAEARARLGELSNAKEDLNFIRHAAGLPDTTAVIPDDVIEAILEERRHELFTEYGHRFFDLKRTGMLDEVLSPSKPGWNHNDQYWPIPNNELLTNPSLYPQNPGY